MKLWCVVWRRRELLYDLSPHASCWLLHPYHGTVPSITLNEENHLVIPHQYIIVANIVQPPLHRGLSPSFIFICSCAGRRQSWWYCGHESLGI